MRSVLAGTIIIFFIVVNGCSPINEHENQGNKYLNLTTEQEAEGSVNPQQNQTVVDSPSLDDSLELEEGIPNQKIIEEPTEEHGSMQQTIPEVPGTEDQLFNNEVTDSIIKISQLPFQDFRERWNAVTDEQMSNLYIHELERVTTNEGEYFSAFLTNELELRILTNNNEHIQQLELISKAKTKSAIISMLTGWNQIVNVLHPGIEIYDVDGLFHHLGVGPNADLTSLKETTVSYNGLDYRVTHLESGFIFTASY